LGFWEQSREVSQLGSRGKLVKELLLHDKLTINAGRAGRLVSKLNSQAKVDTEMGSDGKLVK